MSNQQGPSIEHIPASSRKTCRGCEFLKTHGGVYGHRKVEKNYYCTHPDAAQGLRFLFESGKGICIEYRAEKAPTTPYWCPFNKKSDGTRD